MTRENLAKGICSSKYIYMLERGDRSPSVEMIAKIGEAMQEDLLRYIPYADCDDPVGVARIMEKINESNSHSDYLNLKALTQKAKTMEDFQRKPWSDELQYNEIFCEVYELPWSVAILEKVKEIILVNGGRVNMNDDSEGDLPNPLLKYYNLLAYYHFVAKDFDEAAWLIRHNYSRYKLLRHLPQYRESFISIGLNHLRTLAHSKSFAVMIDEAEDMIAFMRQVKSFDRLHAIHYYLSQAFYHTGRTDEAIREYARFIHAGSSGMNPVDFAVYKSSPYSNIIKETGMLKAVLMEALI